MKTASWVIVDKATGEAVLETFSKYTADRINRVRYDVVPILEWLQQVNRKIRETQS